MRPRAIASALAVLGFGLLAPHAWASFHLAKVTEVMPGTADPGAEYVEIGLPAPGENFFGGHVLTVYGPASTPAGSCTFSGTLPNGESQRSALVATPAGAAAFGVAGDCILPAGDHLSPAGGAACWSGVDCVAWGAVTGTPGLASAVGTPAPAISAGSSLTRSTAGGCATLLEVSDDTNNSAADFALAAPTPRNNASPPGGAPCGSGGGDTKAPETKIEKAPKAKITKRKVKISFSSNEQGSSFSCKLDKGGFKSCHSPFKAKVDLGRHKFKVFATDGAGNADTTPAKAKFKRTERR